MRKKQKDKLNPSGYMIGKKGDDFFKKALPKIFDYNYIYK